MLQICPKLPNQQFEEPPFEEAILTFLRDLGHDEEIKVITDVNINKLHQPWRLFTAFISKCLSGKSTGYDRLRLSQAQILLGMYHKKKIDYAYLKWETKNTKRGNEMYYPCFTKVIINFFMTKDQSIPRRNKINWHFSRDDQMFTTIKVVFRHEDTQLYGAILPYELTNEAIKDSKSYKEYYATASGKRLKTLAKAAKLAKKKQPAKASKAKGLTVLSEVALTEAEQLKIATKRSMIQTQSSYAIGSGADEGTGGKPGVSDVSTYGSNDEKISWKSSEDEDDDENDDDDEADNQDDDGQEDDGQEYDGQDDESQDDDNEETDSDNNGDDFVHLMFSTHDQDERQDEEDSFDPTTNVQTTQVTEDTHAIITLVNPEDVLVTTIAKLPLLSATTLPLPPTPLIKHLQQTLVPTPATVPTSSLKDLSNFGSLFGFDHRLKTLENDFSEFKQTNQFVEAVSLIPSIVDSYLANKMNEAVKIAIQLQSDRLRDEAQAENEDFINKLDDNIKKIIKDQTSHAIATNLSQLKLKKILMDKVESNKSIHRSNEQKNLDKALVDAYESDKLILNAYGDTVTFKRRRNDKDKDEEPSAGSNRGSKSHHKSAGESAQAEEPMHTAKDLEEHAYQEFETGVTEDQPDEETSQLPDWLRIQDIEDMLLLLVQGKLTNLTVEERFIYQNKDKKNRLMHIDELQKFGDGTLNDVRTALDDRLKGIQMKYLPQTIWRQNDKDKVEAMI
uniref:Retrovirus-related Pol polyprotein from transposon TNT 1-94 n=1 Tax=Tanacetum cinerariifolium TaxID=118510 RepID=A0A6L2N083_TANCI|nr:hypothetical protein [Tanacetum cinerariifolium]